MGVRHLAWVLYETSGLTPTANLVLVALADHINDESGWGWPSLARLANVCGIHRRNVLRWLEWLETEGVIEIRRRPGWANHYRLTSGATVTRDASVTSGASVTGGVTHPSLTSGASVTQTRRTRKNQGGALKSAATPTPPPLAQVLKQQDQYR